MKNRVRRWWWNHENEPLKCLTTGSRADRAAAAPTQWLRKARIQRQIWFRESKDSSDKWIWLKVSPKKSLAKLSLNFPCNLGYSYSIFLPSSLSSSIKVRHGLWSYSFFCLWLPLLFLSQVLPLRSSWFNPIWAAISQRTQISTAEISLNATNLT